MPELLKFCGRNYLPGRRFSRLFLFFVGIRDILLEPFLRARPAPAPVLSEIREAVVCKIDYLGDVLMSVPALRLLRRTAPRARITLVVGEWAGALADFFRACGLIDEVVVCNFALLDRSKAGSFQKWKKGWLTGRRAEAELRARNPDLFIEMRPFSPNAWKLGVASRAKYRVGFGLRGMAFTYHYLVPYDFERTYGQLFLDAVNHLAGMSEEYLSPDLPSAKGLAARVLPEGTGPYLVVQLYSGEAVRNVSVSFWKEALAGLKKQYTLVFTGTRADEERAGADGFDLEGGIRLCGRTSIPEFLRVVEESMGVVSVDSFAPHVGLAYGRRAAVLMVDNISQTRSFPKANPNLAFFSPSVNRAGEVVNFFPLATVPAEAAG